MNEVNSIVMLPLDALKPYERNARKHAQEDVAAIAESIREFGFNDPIGIWGKENLIVEGHGRLMAAKELGMKEVPCIRLDHLTDEQRRAYALAHNRTAELSSWDEEMLNLELGDIGDIDMDLMGFDWDAASSLDPIEEPFRDAADIFDPIEEKPEELRTQPGDVWQLGEHRLVCGSSADSADMDKLLKSGGGGMM